jgi:hypothetical protein
LVHSWPNSGVFYHLTGKFRIITQEKQYFRWNSKVEEKQCCFKKLYIQNTLFLYDNIPPDQQPSVYVFYGADLSNKISL